MFFLITLAFLAGVVTVLSPCILPILPIMLSGAVGGRAKPYGITLGFVFSFALFTVFATWIVQSFGIDLDLLRYIAAGVLALMGLFLLFPKLQMKLTSMFKLPSVGSKNRQGFWGGLATGSTLGLVWAPCAGPILAAVITLAATSQANFGAFLIALSYAVGTGVVMLIIILASRKLLDKIKKIYAYLETIHKAFGVLVIVAALGIATGYDRKLQAVIVENIPEGWNSLLQSFETNDKVFDAIDRLQEDGSMPKVNFNVDEDVQAPELVGITQWINSNGETLADLRGKVVVVDFWTYSCINCIRTLPYLTEWHDKYADDGLVILGIHAPEFPFEKKYENVVKATEDFDIKYPVGLDNDFQTWRAYNNRYWPAKYFIDKEGKIRHYHFGEGAYEESEQVIQALLAETGANPKEAISKEEDPDYNRGQTPETYLGFWRLANFANEDQVVPNEVTTFTLDTNLSKNEWTIGGNWNMEEKILNSADANATLRLNFSARDVFLVMGADSLLPVNVKVNGQIIGENDRGGDVNEQGQVAVSDYRLYRLVESDRFIENGLLEITMPAGLQLHAFTFGS